MRRQSVNILEPCTPQRAGRGRHRAQEVGVRVGNFLGKRDCSITIGETQPMQNYIPSMKKLTKNNNT